jgi:sarcosine oxidase subunit beta
MKASPAIFPQSAPGVRHGGGRYSGARLLLEGLRGQRGWPRAWAKAVPRPRYQVVIVGGGGHGLATAYYLASTFGISDVAVLERGPIGLGNVGRNTTLIRSNYFHPDNIRFYDYSLQLWERMERTLNFNTMVSQLGAFPFRACPTCPTSGRSSNKLFHFERSSCYSTRSI